VEKIFARQSIAHEKERKEKIMAKITWLNNTTSTTVGWMFAVHNKQPSTGELLPGARHTEERIDRCEAGVRALAFTGNIAFRESDERDISVLIVD
jgi:hypothetical protein